MLRAGEKKCILGRVMFQREAEKRVLAGVSPSDNWAPQLQLGWGLLTQWQLEVSPGPEEGTSPNAQALVNSCFLLSLWPKQVTCPGPDSSGRK